MVGRTSYIPCNCSTINVTQSALVLQHISCLENFVVYRLVMVLQVLYLHRFAIRVGKWGLYIHRKLCRLVVSARALRPTVPHRSQSAVGPGLLQEAKLHPGQNRLFLVTIAINLYPRQWGTSGSITKPLIPRRRLRTSCC